MGKNVSPRIKRRIKNKFVRALEKAEAQELMREQYFRNRKQKERSESGR